METVLRYVELIVKPSTTAQDIRLESSNEIHAEQGVHSHLGKAILIKRRYARGI